MKNNYFFFSLLLGLLLCFDASSFLWAQSLSSKGTEFWLGLLYGGGTYKQVCISSDKATGGTISSPLKAWKEKFTVTPGATTCIDLPADLVPIGTRIHKGGIKIITDDPVHVFAYHGGNAVTDATCVLPVTSVGNHYYVMSYVEVALGGTSEFLLVPIEGNTEIMMKFPNGSKDSVTLRAGEVYQYQSSTDLSGTDLRSCNDFAVFAGNDCTFIGPCTFCDHLYNQLYPSTTWGKEYVTVPHILRASDIFRVMAREDNTTISLDGAEVTTVNAGGYFDIPLSTPGYISADKPIQVCQFMMGRNCDGVAGADPNMIMLNSLDQMNNPYGKITFECFEPSDQFTHYLNILTKTDNVSLLKLDGAATVSPFAPVPSKPEYSFVQEVITDPGAHTLESDSTFFAMPYGYVVSSNLGDSYGYNIASYLNILNLSPVTEAVKAEAGEDKRICAGDSVQLQASGGLSYFWEPSTGLSDSSIANPQASPPYTTLYTVTVSNNKGCVDKDNVTVVVDALANAVYTYTKDGYELQFTADSSNSIISYFWDFGDRSTTSTERTTSHTYLQQSTFTVTLIVTNKCGSDTVMFDINIDGTSGGGGNVGLENQALNTFKVKVYPNPATNLLTIEWQLGKPSPVEFAIYNSLGEKIRELTKEVKSIGKLQSNVELNDIVPGVYFYEFITEDEYRCGSFFISPY